MPFDHQFVNLRPVRNHRYFIVLSLIVLSLTARSQEAELIIQSPAEFTFFLKVNGAQQSDSLMNIYYIPLEDPSQLNIDIWTKEPSPKGTFTLRLKPGFRYTYDLRKIDQNLSLLPFSKTPMPPKPVLEPDTLEPAVTDPISPYVPVIIPDSLITPMWQYDGPRGCDFPLSNSEFQRELKAVSELYFERERRKYIERLVSDECIMVKQLAALLDHIELEDVRLEIIASVRHKVFDIDAISSLSSLFQLSASKSAFDEMIGK